MKRRLTVAQAIIAFLKNQYSCRDGKERRFFEGCFGIFGHGNVAGIGQALEQDPELTYYLCRNEQAMVHAAAGFAKNVPVAEDPEAPFEKAALLSVAAGILILEESDDSLRNRKSSLHGVTLLGRMRCGPKLGFLCPRT